VIGSVVSPPPAPQLHEGLSTTRCRCGIFTHRGRPDAEGCDAFNHEQYLYELKRDGFRALAHVTQHDVRTGYEPPEQCPSVLYADHIERNGVEFFRLACQQEGVVA
jgi:hypothetical protein